MSLSYWVRYSTDTFRAFGWFLLWYSGKGLLAAGATSSEFWFLFVKFIFFK
jgi:hypothetical protein